MSDDFIHQKSGFRKVMLVIAVRGPIFFTFSNKELSHFTEMGPLKVNDMCIDDSRECPVGSYCDPLTSVCVCEDGLRPHSDNSHCRRGLFSERSSYNLFFTLICTIFALFPSTRIHSYCCN